MLAEVSVLKVMVASPSDVATTCNIAHEVMHEWNATHVDSQRAILLPIDWKRNVTPELGSRPQDIINKQILNESDILVAIFWKTLGSPTGKSTSGTIEEIEEFISTGKPVLLYFSNTPVNPSEIDTEQLTALKEYKGKMRNSGIYHEFNDISSFRSDFARHLHSAVLTSCSRNAKSKQIKEEQTITLKGDPVYLLKHASMDKNGIIIRSITNGGMRVWTNQINICAGGNAREEARWQEAIDTLEQYGLISTSNGNIYQVTNQGYKAADQVDEKDIADTPVPVSE